MLEEGAQYRQVGPGGQPYGQRHGPRQPVGIELGIAGAKVDDAELQDQKVDGPGRYVGDAPARAPPYVEREAPVGRQKDEQKSQQTDQVVMIQVIGEVG